MTHIEKYFHIVGEKDGVLIVEIPSYTFIMIIAHVFPEDSDKEKYFYGIEEEGGYRGLSYMFNIRKFYEETGIDFVEKFKEVIPRRMPTPYVPEEFYRYDAIIFRINNALQEFRYTDEEIRREVRTHLGINEIPES